MKPPRKKTILAVSVALAGTSSALAADGNSPQRADEKQAAGSPVHTEMTTPGATDPLVRDFDQARQAYLAKRDAAKKSQRGISEADRQAVRDRLQGQRDEQVRAREELRQQLREKREQLPNHRDVIDDARERVRERPRRGE